MLRYISNNTEGRPYLLKHTQPYPTRTQRNNLIFLQALSFKTVLQT